MHNYFFLDVVEGQWSDLQKSLLESKSFGQMLDVHVAFVSKLTQHCFVEDRQKAVTAKFVHLLQLATELVDLCLSMKVSDYSNPDDLFLQEDEVEQFNSLESEFEICRDWLMRVLAQLDGNTTGFCRPLFERLNYNRFYIQ